MIQETWTRIGRTEPGAFVPWLIVVGWLLGAFLAFWFVMLGVAARNAYNDPKDSQNAMGGCLVVGGAIGAMLLFSMSVNGVWSSFLFVLDNLGDTPFHVARQLITSEL